MPGVLWCDVPEDCGSYCTFVPRGEKKKEENRFLLSHKWEVVQSLSVGHFTPAFSNLEISAG